MQRASSPHRHALLVGEKQAGPRALLAALARELQREGVGVTAAENGRSAMRSLAERRFDLVLCDIHMPRTAGFSLVYCLERPVAVASLLRAVMRQLRTTGLHGRFPGASRAPRTGASDHVSATVAKNEFGRVLETALKRGHVVITKHNAPKAELLSADEYEALSGQKTPETPDLGALHAEFDELLERMQAPRARAATSALFEASSSKLGAAAVAAARASKASVPARG